MEDFSHGVQGQQKVFSIFIMYVTRVYGNIINIYIRFFQQRYHKIILSGCPWKNIVHNSHKITNFTKY